MIMKLFSWGCLAGGRKLFILGHVESLIESLVTLPNIEKITLSTL